MGLQQIPSLVDFGDLVTLLNHGVVYLSIEEHHFLNFDGQVVFV